MVNVETGTYYSLRDTGAEIWELLQGGMGCGEIVARLDRRYEAAPGEIETVVGELLAELTEEGILTPGRDDDAPRAEDGAETPGAARAAFARPQFEKHTDMKDLLLIDPIHEVDETGWPVVTVPGR